MTADFRCPVVGIVGGVGSGKSTLARNTAARFGYVVVDGDAAGHRALSLPDVQHQLRNRFGDSIFRADGSVDRSALAGRVFGSDPDQIAAKHDLESMVHPVIRTDCLEQIAAGRASGAGAALLDAAILLEAGWRNECDLILFVETPAEMRKTQVMTQRGWTPQQWERREESQLSLQEKRWQADVIIDNSGPIEQAVLQAGQVIEAWKANQISKRYSDSRQTVPGDARR